MVEFNHIRALFQYPTRRLIVRSREVSKPLDLYLELYDRSDIWQAHWQHCYRCACQISKRCNDWNYQSRGFETSLDLMIRRIIGYWRIQVASLPLSKSCDCPNTSDGVLTISFKVSALALWQRVMLGVMIRIFRISEATLKHVNESYASIKFRTETVQNSSITENCAPTYERMIGSAAVAANRLHLEHIRFENRIHILDHTPPSYTTAQYRVHVLQLYGQKSIFIYNQSDIITWYRFFYIHTHESLNL